MRLRFSLSTLLICTAAVAVACAFSVAISVPDSELIIEPGAFGNLPVGHITYFDRAPTAAEIALRLAWSAPLAVAATLAALHVIRRLCSRSGNDRRAKKDV